MVRTFLAATIYLPLSRGARRVERCGGLVQNIPLLLRSHGGATLGAHPLHRFGTPLEHRFGKTEVEARMTGAGLTGHSFAQGPPYLIATGFKV